MATSDPAPADRALRPDRGLLRLRGVSGRLGGPGAPLRRPWHQRADDRLAREEAVSGRGPAPPAGRVLEVLVAAPTVRVERIELAGGGRAVRKIYSLPRFGQRLRLAFGPGWLGRPKGEREADNLRRLHRGGAAAPPPLAAGSRRDRLGFVRQSWLLLPDLSPRPTLAEVLAGRAPVPTAFADRERLWQAVGASVADIHRLGCFYRDLRARNLLLGEGDLFWIDAAKSRWAKPPLAAAAAALDLAGFVLPLDLPPSAWSALIAGYGAFTDLERPQQLSRLLGRRRRRRLARVLAREAQRQSAGRNPVRIDGP
ncbi:MAG: hypothetical protein D6702_09265 [Planctomycetota bacterium]|nr:MAG: hypothetical protein D6702_09265 [Planctomycetota bacterium]